MKKYWKLFVTLFSIILVLSACGGSSKEAITVAETAAAMAPAAGAMDGAYREEFSYSEAKAEETAVNSSGSSLTTSDGISTQKSIGRKLIRTIHLDVETDDFDNLLQELNDQIQTLSGYIEQSDISGHSIQYESSRRRAYMTVRIPSTKLDQFVDSMETNANITNKSETTTDITLKYSDLESRKKSLTIEQDRIWALLEKADTLEAVIALEERLSEIRYELESMESKLRLYDNQVDYSTVYVNISEVKVYTPTAPATIGERIHKGFTRNVENLKDCVVDLLVWTASSTPFLFPLAILMLIAVFIIRKIRTHKSIRSIASKLPLDVKSNENDENS